MYPRQKLSSLELWHLVLMSVLFLILVSSPKAILLIFLFFSIWYWSNESTLGFFCFQGPTWTTLKSAFVMLGVCLAVMFGLAFSSSDSSLILHVGLLLLIALTLFFLLSWYSSYFLLTLSIFSTVYFIFIFIFIFLGMPC